MIICFDFFFREGLVHEFAFECRLTLPVEFPSYLKAAQFVLSDALIEQANLVRMLHHDDQIDIVPGLSGFFQFLKNSFNRSGMIFKPSH